MKGIVVSGILDLLAFLLAFAIGIAISQHTSRKAMVVSEANVIGTAYLRAGLIGDSERDASRDLMCQYVDLRLAVHSDPTQLESVLARSEEIHSLLWPIVEENIEQGSDPEKLVPYVESCVTSNPSTCFDLHGQSIGGAQDTLHHPLRSEPLCKPRRKVLG